MRKLCVGTYVYIHLFSSEYYTLFRSEKPTRQADFIGNVATCFPSLKGAPPLVLKVDVLWETKTVTRLGIPESHITGKILSKGLDPVLE